MRQYDDNQIRVLRSSYNQNILKIEHTYDDYQKLRVADKRIRRRGVVLEMAELFELVTDLQQILPFLRKYSPPPEIQEMLNEARRPPQPRQFRPERTLLRDGNVTRILHGS